MSIDHDDVQPWNPSLPWVPARPIESQVFGKMKEATRDTRLHHSYFQSGEYFSWLRQMETELAEYAVYRLKSEIAWSRVEVSREMMLSAVPDSMAYESARVEIEKQKREYSSAIRYADYHLHRFQNLTRKIVHTEI